MILLGRSIDLTGKIFGKLKVLYKCDYRNENNEILWKCKCDCGELIIVAQGHLKPRNGYNKSCGCISKKSVSETGKVFGGRNFQDLSGQIFGWLKVIERIWSVKKCPVYKCKCLICGNEKIVKGKLLKNGHVKSCGCLKSIAEKEIQLFLKKLKIKFEQEYRFKDCRRIYPLPFDFAIFNEDGDIKLLIEFDGIQHYIQQDNLGDLAYIQENDSIKTNYCKENNIPLLRIPYYESNNKEELILEYIEDLI